jgi:hypothetical protein
VPARPLIDQLWESMSAARGSVLVIDDGSPVARRRSAEAPPRIVRWNLVEESVPVSDVAWGGVALLVRDRQSLRRAATLLPHLGRSERVWCWLEDCGGWAPAPALHPAWPRLRDMAVKTAGAGLAALEFAAPAPVREVLISIGGGNSGQRKMWPGQPLLAAARGEAGQWLPASPDSLIRDDLGQLLTEGEVLPPDGVLAADPVALVAAVPEGDHPTSRRPIARVAVSPLRAWSDLASDLRLDDSPVQFDDLAVPPVDERVVNPIGFERNWSRPVTPVEPSFWSPDEVTVQLSRGPLRIDARAGLKESDLKALRTLQGVDLRWRGGHGPQAYARLVAAMAMAGVPVAPTTVPRWARHLLDPQLVHELERPADLADRLGREERSVRLRRAALAAHSMHGWRTRLARRNGLPEPRTPGISVLLATRRPEMLSFALRQVTKQRLVGGEILLAAHGFEADAAVTDVVRDHPEWNLRVVHHPSSRPFGEVLNVTAEQATGDVLVKMDDDDWYGPHFIFDLLQARNYSGADVVGMPAEFFFLEALWRTIRRPDATERFTPRTAGATIMIGRTTLFDVGGFRLISRAVDSALFNAVREGGGLIYQVQGLGFMVRRAASGHTWDPGLGYFLRRKAVSGQWHGFHPSSELGVDEADVPRRLPELDVALTGVSP